MVKSLRALSFRILMAVLLSLPAVGLTADFELFWDPNCNVDPELEGYYIYYKEGSSVVSAPHDAISVYVPLTNHEFSISDPSYQISDLIDDTLYCFAITAWYGNEESEMSNEVCGVNGFYAQEPDPDPGPDPDPDPDPTPGPGPGPGPVTNTSGGGGSSGGCFIDALF